LKLDCKVWPIEKPHPAFPHDTYEWRWIVHVKLIYRHSPITKWFEAFIDSGSPWCLFHANFCKSLGIDLESGIRDDLKGIIGGPSAPMYFHKIKVCLGSWSFNTMAGFSTALSVGGILGRRGFFENFKVTFDPLTLPPSIELEQIHRS
jgi:hypothetical protein